MLPRRVLAGLALAFGAVVVLHLVGGGADGSRLQPLFDAAHVPGFALVAAAVIKLTVAEPVGLPNGRVLALALSSVAALALVSEAAQILTSRDANLGDLGRDAAGIVAGTAAVFAARMRAWGRAGMAALATAALVVGVFAPGRVIVARLAAARSLPLLAGFESDLEALLVVGTNADLERVPAPVAWPLAGRVGLVSPLPGRPYPGVAFGDLPRDWGDYEALSFLVAAERETLTELSIRVHDSTHDNTFTDRFNRTFAVGPAAARVRISLADIRAAPRGRSLDLARVEQIIVFATGPEAGGFWVDDLRLE